MIRSIRKAALLSAAAVLLLVGAGCPDSTVINPGNGVVSLDIQLTNPSRFDSGFFSIDKLVVRPVDAGANQALGSARDISILQNSVFIDITVPVDPAFLTPAPLSVGAYEVVGFTMSGFEFFDFDATDPSTCESFQSSYEQKGQFDFVPITNFAPVPTFTVSADGVTSLVVRFDMTAFFSTFNSAYTCTPLGGGGFSISNYQRFTVAAGYANFLSFE